jgi:hypothetical protein
MPTQLRQFVVHINDGSRRLMKAAVRPETNLVEFFDNYFENRRELSLINSKRIFVIEVHELTPVAEAERIVEDDAIERMDDRAESDQQVAPAKAEPRRSRLRKKIDAWREHALFDVAWTTSTIAGLVAINLLLHGCQFVSH